MPVLVILLAAAALLVIAFSTSPSFRAKVLGIWQKKFGDKGISRKRNDARFAQALAMGMASGLPLEEAVALCATLLRDSPAAAQRCEACAERLQEGGDLADALLESGMLPPAACRLLTLGLRGGSGDTAMEEIARRLSDEADRALERRVAQVEPALVLVTSLLVGAILLSVMLPLMNIMTAIG
jgi:type IV pilus assembly protein PilC